ncbi:MAG: hypothetical protein HKP16_01880 [Xanthomonadales bacterium]|nr:hypothetical protein [Xanthomonadales bacterium]
MKRIFVVALALSVGACASQPQNPVSSNDAVSGPYAQASLNQPAKSPDRAYKDDYQRLLLRASPRDSRVLILGRKDKATEEDSGLE